MSYDDSWADAWWVQEMLGAFERGDPLLSCLTREDVARRRRKLGADRASLFAAQYQQQPAPPPAREVPVRALRGWRLAADRIDTALGQCWELLEQDPSGTCEPRHPLPLPRGGGSKNL